MPSYLPPSSVDRVSKARLEFTEEGIARLVQLSQDLVDNLEIRDEDVEFLVEISGLNNEPFDATLFSYQPAREQTREFDERLILRGWEVDAFSRLLEDSKRKSDRLDWLTNFKKQYIDRGLPAHIDTRDV